MLSLQQLFRKKGHVTKERQSLKCVPASRFRNISPDNMFPKDMSPSNISLSESRSLNIETRVSTRNLKSNGNFQVNTSCPAKRG